MSPPNDRHRGDDRPGVRIGPMVFVPELSTSASDPWAHRKGEPRVFTLLWAIYLLIGAMTTLFATRTIGPPTPSSYRAGCLAMITVVGAGAALLWPLTRLSQRSPSNAPRSVGADLVVILVPVLAVVVPMPVLTRWPWVITIAMTLALAGWTVLIGGIIAVGIARPVNLVRAALMVMIAMLVIGGPAVALMGSGVRWAGVRTAMLTSPVTVHWALADTPANMRPSMTTQEWAMVIAPYLVAAVVWIWVAMGGARPSVSPGPHGPTPGPG